MFSIAVALRPRTSADTQRRTDRMDTKEMMAKGHLFKMDKGQYRSADSAKGVFHFELPKELEDTYDSNGHVTKQKVVNLCCISPETAAERAESIVASRIREHMTMEATKDGGGMDLLDETLRRVNPNGGDPVSAWGRYSAQKKAELTVPELLQRQDAFKSFTQWRGEGSLYDVSEKEANEYISFLCRSTTGTRIWKKVIPALNEIWSVSLPLCSNPWAGFKYDSKRKAVVPEDSPALSAEWLDKPLRKFFAEYFKREAASGRKWEQNTAGFLSHLQKHTGVKLVKDVTKRVALDYALKMAKGDGTKVARSGADRISKFTTIWNEMLPGFPNPWKDVSCEDAERAAIYNQLVRGEEPRLMTVSEIIRCIHPDVVWLQFAARHEMKKKRAGTVKAIFLRMWEKTGIRNMLDVSSEVAAKYISEVMADKKSGDQDLDELGLIWWTLFPGTPNPWKVEGDRKEPPERKPRVVVNPPVDCKPVEIMSAPPPEKKDVPSCEVQEDASQEEGEVNVEVHHEPVVEVVTVDDPVAMADEAEPSEEKTYTFNEIYEVWRKAHEGRYKPGTYYSYRQKMSVFSDFMGKKGVTCVSKSTVDIATVREFLAEVSKNVTTPVNYISPLKVIWDTAFGIVENPWRAVYGEYVSPKGVPVQDEPDTSKKIESVSVSIEKPVETVTKTKVRNSFWRVLLRAVGRLFGAR